MARLKIILWLLALTATAPAFAQSTAKVRTVPGYGSGEKTGLEYVQDIMRAEGLPATDAVGGSGREIGPAAMRMGFGRAQNNHARVAVTLSNRSNVDYCAYAKGRITLRGDRGAVLELLGMGSTTDRVFLFPARSWQMIQQGWRNLNDMPLQNAYGSNDLTFALWPALPNPPGTQGVGLRRIRCATPPAGFEAWRNGPISNDFVVAG